MLSINQYLGINMLMRAKTDNRGRSGEPLTVLDATMSGICFDSLRVFPFLLLPAFL